MKIALVTIGKTNISELRDSLADYSRRIGRYSPFELVDTSDDKLEKTLEKFERIFLLDEHGREYTSVEMSQFLEKQLLMSPKSLAFVVGGPFGFTRAIRDMADGQIALSKMTFPHDLVRVIFLEQLYRAFTILKNEKYHHE
ncbi:MAG: 23S rRNA (pseudouridine(1915)-N(3))-methyltransferase RlmH [Candidatus Paceibacterota bacterium]|jgi:23S rRNA (pseudouridine1915-N3)-methyltransferase